MKKDLQNIELLSAYLDDELSHQEKIDVEKLLATSLELQKKLEDLKKIKRLTSSVTRIPESPFFETRLMSSIEGQKNEQFGLKRWLPVSALALVTIVVMLIVKYNSEIFDKLWEDQKVAIAGFYKENLQPVLLTANLTNEDIFNFAFNNELPLDSTHQQYLLVSYDDAGKEFFELLSSDQRINRTSYDKFISAMDLDKIQKQTVDSIISSYSSALQAQVLINQNNTIAINPNLWNLRKAIFADLLVAAEKLNKEKFDRIVPDGISESERVSVVNAISKLKNLSGDSYIFVTPDSIFEDSYEFNPLLAEKQIALNEQQVEMNEKKIGENIFKFQFDSSLAFNSESKGKYSFKVVVDSNICRVDIPDFIIPEIPIPEIAEIDPLIEQATNNIHFYAYKVPKIEKSNNEIKIEYFNDDSIYSYVVDYNSLNFDSLVEANQGMDLMNLGKFNPIHPSDDTMLIKYQFDRDYYHRYYSDEEFKKEMEALQKELQELSKQFNNNKVRVNTEVTKGHKK